MSTSQTHSRTDPVRGDRSEEFIRIGVQPTLRGYLQEIWNRREFIATMSLGQLRAQNQNTVLGNLWHLLNPLLLAAVYYFVFGILFDAARTIDNYPAYLVIGLLVYTFTGKAMNTGARAVVSNLPMMQAINFPRAVLPVSAASTETFAQVTALGAMLAIALITGVVPTATWVLIVPALVLHAVFNLGLAFITARATFHFRDVEQVIPYILRIWMYVSGVFFTADFVDRHGNALLSVAFRLNPLWAFMQLNRDALLRNQFNWRYWALASVWAVLIALFGFVFFWWNETEYSRG